MLSVVKNFQIQLYKGQSRWVAATHHESVGANLIFYCGDRIVLLQRKDQVRWCREFTFPQAIARRKVRAA